MEGLIENAMDACKRCLENPNDYNGRADLMWTCNTSLKRPDRSRAWQGRLSHAYDRALSQRPVQHTPWRRPFHCHTRLAQMVFQNQCGTNCHSWKKNIPAPDLEAYTDEQMAKGTITMLHNWFGRIDSPTSLEEVDIPKTDIPQIAENALALGQGLAINELYHMKQSKKFSTFCK